ncbi:hypothetical protein EJ04DRAFT_175777 [Polyplosphaeria fusca]|uniref:Uncharacterized protein n=1 Tax=Polyplosphaeria fusca TaxID=682080 RepID=A0A9P4QYX6_9PLEO|nr:hypothetical protein EJ04DRAFT_175777 [Polyplosphaeria fusca]
MWWNRRGKTSKLKEPAARQGSTRAAATEGDPSPLTTDGLRRTPSRRSSQRKRRSVTSMRHVDKKSSPVTTPAHKHHTFPQVSVEDITALPHSRRLQQSPHLRPISHDHAIPYNFQPNSQVSLPSARDRGKLQRPQSLRKRPAHESTPTRRKSSKRRKDDHLREEEIRAMSMPLPQKRPAGHSGGMLRRDSKKVKGGLNRHFDRPTSNISLPLEESIHSSMSGNSETRAYRVSAFAMFSPRPKIRYSVGSQYYYGTAGPSPTSQDKSESRKERRTATGNDGELEHQRSKRIDDLADTLDAGALREILERDKRRKEKKRKQEEDRLRRRLERRAEKQRIAEQGGTPATPRQTARGTVGLGIERPTSAMEDVRPTTPPPPQKLDTADLATKVGQNSQLPTPLDSPVDEPVVANAQAVRYSKASMPSPTATGHTRDPSDVSHMPALLSEIAAQDRPIESVEPPAVQDATASGSLHAVQSTDTAASKKGAGRRRSSEGRRMGLFASFFRRGKRSSQEPGARTTPSEASFSNTSRESMSKQPLPAHLVGPTQPIQIRRPSSVPHRTMSKFREDLPEFPLSPPDSRVQSPEAAAAGAAITHHQSLPAVGTDSSSPGFGRTDSPVSPGVPTQGLMSQSLASVDSEGSWLSGKPMQRRSNKSHIRSSVGSSTAIKRNEEFNASYEELGIPDDEYFKRLTPQPDERRRSGDLMARKASSTAMAAMDVAAESDDEGPPASQQPADEDENVVQSSVGRQPTIVHRQARVKSTEGLLSFYYNDKASEPAHNAGLHADTTEPESPTSDAEPALLQRAKSVDLGKNHVRHLSAGSAKLLDIPAKRGSMDQKRSSSSSQTAIPDTS